MPPDLAPIEIAALIAPDERDTIVAAAHRLSRCLGEGADSWPVRLHFASAGEELPNPSAALIASLRVDADVFTAPLDTIGKRWEERVAAARESGHAAIFMLTLFRHVSDAAARPAMAERIRRLNLLAVRLSRSSGVQIVDIDRAFALVGARTIDSDYRGQGDLAPLVAAHAIVAAVLEAGLDPQVPPERQEQARHRNGGRDTVAAIVAHHRQERI